MRTVYVEPHGRDLTAKNGYKFMSWYFRYMDWKHGFAKKAEKALMDAMIYGTGVIDMGVGINEQAVHEERA